MNLPSPDQRQINPILREMKIRELSPKASASEASWRGLLLQNSDVVTFTAEDGSLPRLSASSVHSTEVLE